MKQQQNIRHHHYYRFICAVCLLSLPFISQKITAQVEQTQILLPQQYEKNVSKKSSAIQETFYEYPYTGNAIDLSDFKKIHPQADLPDTLQIDAPLLDTSSSPIILMGYFKQTQLHTTDAFVLLLVENINKQFVTFYVDKNLDGYYFNDGPPITLEAGNKAYPVEIIPPNQPVRTFWLELPEQPDRVEAILKDFKKKEKIKIINRFTVEFHAGVGSGKTLYQFDDLNRGFPTWYSVQQSEKYLGVALSYDIPILRVGVSATYQNLFHYTSYTNIRHDNPEVLIDPNTNQRRIRENVQIERNIDRHAKNRLQWGAFLMGRIPIKKFAELQPIVAVGKISTLPNEYLSDTRRGVNISYALPANTFIETGLRFEFTAGQQRAFFIGISRYELQWKPSDFLEEGQANYQSTANTWKALLGYRLAL